MALPDDLIVPARQEQELQWPRFDEELAWQLGARLRELARGRRLAVVIDVQRFGQPLFYCALAGTTPDHAQWVRRKSGVVARFHRSSYRVGLELQLKGTTLAEKFGLATADYASMAGVFRSRRRRRASLER